MNTCPRCENDNLTDHVLCPTCRSEAATTYIKQICVACGRAFLIPQSAINTAKRICYHYDCVAEGKAA